MTLVPDAQGSQTDRPLRLVHVGSLDLPLHDLLRRIRCLSAPERDVLELRLGLGQPRRTVAQSARELGFTPLQVRRIETIAHSKLRHPSTAA